MTPDEVDRPQPVDNGWEQRLRDAVADTLRRRAEAAAWRAEFAERRRHGLAARHREKLARAKSGYPNTEETPVNTVYTTATDGEDPDAGPRHNWAITINGRYVSGDRGNELNPVLTDLRGNSRRWHTYPDAAAAASRIRTFKHPRADYPRWADADIQIIRIERPRRFR
jgi:hypothetical protein